MPELPEVEILEAFRARRVYAVLSEGWLSQVQKARRFLRFYRGQLILGNGAPPVEARARCVGRSEWQRSESVLRLRGENLPPGAGLRSLAEPVVDTTSDFAELVLAMLGVFAKLERRRIKKRTARGRADAKANGVKFGRKPNLTPHQKREAIKRRDREGETLSSIGRSYNVSAATIGRLS